MSLDKGYGVAKKKGTKTPGRVDPAKDIQKSKAVSPKIGYTTADGSKPTTSASTGGTGKSGSTGSLGDVIGGAPNTTASVVGGGDHTGTGSTHTAFGDHFTPAMYDQVWSNPDSLVYQSLKDHGIGTRGGTYAALLDQANNMGLLWMLQQGKGAAEGTPGFIDWSGQYLDNQLTPGGHSISAADIAGDLKGAAGDPNNPNYEYLANSGLTPSDQVGNNLSTLNTALKGANLPDIVRSAYLARARELGDQFQNQRYTGHDNGHSFLNSLISSGYLDSLGG